MLVQPLQLVFVVDDGHSNASLTKLSNVRNRFARMSVDDPCRTIELGATRLTNQVKFFGRRTIESTAQFSDDFNDKTARIAFHGVKRTNSTEKMRPLEKLTGVMREIDDVERIVVVGRKIGATFPREQSS